MKRNDTRFFVMLCLVGLAGGSALGEGQRKKGFSPAAGAPGFAPPAYLEADKLFDDIQGSEEAFVKRCIHGLPKVAADLDARLKNADRSVEQKLGKRPDYRPYPPDVESFVCDQRNPYIKVAQFLIGVGAKDPPQISKYSLRAIKESRLAAIKYYSCLASTQNNGAACDPLKTIPASMERVPVQAFGVTNVQTPQFLGEAASAAERCVRNKDEIVLAKALITGDPSAKQVCLDVCRRNGVGTVLVVDKEMGDAGSCPTICSLAVKHRNEPERFCAAALPVVNNAPMAVKACRDKEFSAFVGLGNGLDKQEMRAMINDPDAKKHPCAQGQPCFDMDDVLAYSSFRKAFASKNKALCGDSIKCRVMMGDNPQICEPIAASVRAEVCGEREKLVKQQEWDRARAAAVKPFNGMQMMLSQYHDECSKSLDQMKAMHDKIGSLLSTPPNYRSKEVRAQKLNVFWGRLGAINKKFLSINASAPANTSP